VNYGNLKEFNKVQLKKRTSRVTLEVFRKSIGLYDFNTYLFQELVSYLFGKGVKWVEYKKLYDLKAMTNQNDFKVIEDSLLLVFKLAVNKSYTKLVLESNDLKSGEFLD